MDLQTFFYTKQKSGAGKIPDAAFGISWSSRCSGRLNPDLDHAWVAFAALLSEEHCTSDQAEDGCHGTKFNLDVCQA